MLVYSKGERRGQYEKRKAYENAFYEIGTHVGIDCLIHVKPKMVTVLRSLVDIRGLVNGREQAGIAQRTGKPGDEGRVGIDLRSLEFYDYAVYGDRFLCGLMALNKLVMGFWCGIDGKTRTAGKKDYDCKDEEASEMDHDLAPLL
jgi:hypothetical protein